MISRCRLVDETIGWYLWKRKIEECHWKIDMNGKYWDGKNWWQDRWYSLKRVKRLPERIKRVDGLPR
jgi:hypothetical protein